MTNQTSDPLSLPSDRLRELVAKWRGYTYGFENSFNDGQAQAYHFASKELEEVIPDLLTAIAEREQQIARLNETTIRLLNQQTQLVDDERRRWYRAFAWVGDLEGFAPEIVAEKVSTLLASAGRST